MGRPLPARVKCSLAPPASIFESVHSTPAILGFLPYREGSLQPNPWVSNSGWAYLRVADLRWRVGARAASHAVRRGDLGPRSRAHRRGAGGDGGSRARGMTMITVTHDRAQA